jgi:ribosome-binding factor A
MTFKKPSPKDMLPLCREISPEDGMDPREFARKGRPRKGDRKLRQLCSQVAETLSLVLSGECADEVLHSLQVVAVEPAPDASQLLVTVCTSLPEDTIDASDAMARLTGSMAKLRCEVAAAITRKRAPKLVFRVL